MYLRKLFPKLNLRFKDSAEEREYSELRIPVLHTFFTFLFLSLSIVMIPYSVRFFVKEVYVQGYLAVGFLILAVFLCLLRNKLSNHFENIVLVFLIGMLGMISTAAHELLKAANPSEAFFMGHAYALILRLVGYRILRFQYMALMHAVVIVIKFSVLGAGSALLPVMNIVLESVSLIMSLRSELGERSLFDSMFRAKRDTIKFKHLLTEYLPNQMAIFTLNHCEVKYVNKSFKRFFRCENQKNALSCLDKLVIEKEILQKYKDMFARFGYIYENDAQPLKLSDLTASISNYPEAMKELGTINTIVKQDEARGDSAENRGIEELRSQRDTIFISNNTGTRQRSPPAIARLAHRGGNSASGNGRRMKKEDGFLKRLFFPAKLPKENQEASKEQSQSFQEEIDGLALDRAGSKSNFSDASDEGKKKIFKVKIFLLLWDEEEAIAVFLDDITKQKTISELRIADKNKDLVIAMVSHELRTPLNGMIGIIDIMKRNLQQEELIPYMNACRNNGLLLLSLVNSILDMSQIKNNKFKFIYGKVSIGGLLNELRSLFEYFCVPKNLYLKTEIDPNVPKTIITDKNRLSQILINLLGNAFKFTFKGGITVKVELENQDPYKVKFSVRDTGIGIKAEDLDKLFKLFGRLEHEDKRINTSGVGLGLTISNTLALLLNPSDEKGIHVESEPDKGSIFSFVIQDKAADPQLETEAGGLTSETEMSTSFDEDKEATVSKKMSLYTLNGVDNFFKNPNSIQNLESRLMSSPGTILKKVGIRDPNEMFGSLSGLNDEVLWKNNQKKEGNTNNNNNLEVIMDNNSSDKEEMMEGVDEESKEQEQKRTTRRGTIQLDLKPWCLIVDDNPFNLMVASHALEERGFRVKQALNGKDAIEKITEHEESGQTFQVILMDCQMPVMDGYEATRVLRKMMNAGEITECPILALTANDRDEGHERLCKEVGMCGSITKPLQPNELEATLKKLEKMNQKK